MGRRLPDPRRPRLPLVVAGGSLLGGCGARAAGTTETEGATDHGELTQGESSGHTASSGGPQPMSDSGGQVSVPGAPQLIDANLINGATIELVFNEAIAPLGPVDLAKFRLSAAFASPYAYQPATLYADLGIWNVVEECYEQCPSSEGGEEPQCYQTCYTPPGSPLHVQSLAHGSAPDHLILGLDQVVGPGVCGALQQRLDQGSEAAAIFLHYSNNGPGIVDFDGDQLEAIAELWTLQKNQQYFYQQGFFPAMSPFIPIHCPF